MTADRTARQCDFGRMLVAGKMLLAAMVWLSSGTWVSAAEKSAHWHHAGAMPPGAIGRQRLLRGGALSGACQPVEIRAPHGARIAPAAGTSFLEGAPDRLLVGLAIGPVYRFRVTEIPEHPGLEVFPSVEMIDRLYPPPGQALRFPVPIELTLDELLQAAEGRFITRVIYLEDPLLAPAIARDGEQLPWVEARPGDDPLVMADHLGRPLAILRMGGRVPENSMSDAGFTYGSPQAIVLDQPPVEFDHGAEETLIVPEADVQPLP
ncbi:hypothetical protein [Bythopirellula polymerisocia]|nr:hypothetical protein [Bythopirellula polymerisocia]